VGAAYNLQFFDFYDINASVFTPTSTALGFGFKDPYRLAYLEEFVQVDLRNRSVARRPGGYLGVRVEEGSPLFGGEFRYLALVPEVKVFVPLTRRVVVGARALAGWLRPFGGGAATDSPVTRRFRLGGPSSHRGFGFGRLSPQIADQDGNPVPVGGDAELLLSVEVRTEITRVAGNWLSLVPFFDAGDVTPSFDGISLGRLHRAAGLAAEYASPIGVVRAGAAARLNRVSGVAVAGQPIENPDPGQRFAFHVTIGEAF
jgi:translocation and assembly module TamA